MLGRGLGSLIPEKNTGTEDGRKTPAKPVYQNRSEAVFQIEVESIKPNPYQPRRRFDEESLKELAASIREFGLLQPLVVSKIEKETEFGAAVEYQLIAGERRLLAARLLGLERVPVIVRNVDLEKERLEMAIVENIQRADLNPVETARAYARLADEFKLTQREVAARVGKSREAVANALRLLSLPSKIQEALAGGRISESQARILLAAGDPVRQETLFNELLSGDLTVRELKKKAVGLKLAVEAEAGSRPDPEVLAFKNRLEDVLGSRVAIKKSGDGGKIVIDFFSPEEFYGLVAKILGESEKF